MLWNLCHTWNTVFFHRYFKLPFFPLYIGSHFSVSFYVCAIHRNLGIKNNVWILFSPCHLKFVVRLLICLACWLYSFSKVCFSYSIKFMASPLSRNSLGCAHRHPVCSLSLILPRCLSRSRWKHHRHPLFLSEVH